MGGGVDWWLIAIGAVGALALGGIGTAVGVRRRRPTVGRRGAVG